MSRTIENLKAAFAGESQANRRYLAFARKADDEGFPQIARLFRAAAEAETVHALNHLRVLGEIKTTKSNVGTAVSGETYEFKTMYPEYLTLAEQDENSQAVWSFDVASKVEQVHARLYQRASKALENNKDLKDANYYVCQLCGNTVENEPPEKCPICNARKEKFFKTN